MAVEFISATGGSGHVASGDKLRILIENNILIGLRIISKSVSSIMIAILIFLINHSSLGEVPREQKMLKRHLRFVYHQVY